MIAAKVQIKHTSAETLFCHPLPKGASGLKVAFEFCDPLWSTLSKTAVFRNHDKTIDAIVTDDCAIIPHELLAEVGNPVHVGIYGTNTQNNLVIPIVWAILGDVCSASNPSGESSAEPTFPYWAQIQEQVNSLHKEMMTQEDLENALLQAKESGAFDGPQGPQGEQGKPGIPGVAGKDGYTPVAGKDYWTQEEKNKMTSNAAYMAAEQVQLYSDIVCDAVGNTIILEDTSGRNLRGLCIYGKTTQNGMPTPDAPFPLNNVGYSGSITVKVGTSEIDANPQTLIISTPNGLPGIPVSSGGNYTDKTGQQWICDEVDFARGVYVKRIASMVLNGEETSWILSGTYPGSAYIYYRDLGLPEARPNQAHICSHATMRYSFDTYAFGGSVVEQGAVSVWLKNGTYTDISELQKLLRTEHENGTPVTIYYLLLNLEYHNLSAEELAQYAALHTNYPNTTIFNDAGTGMEIKYIADTKSYIDRKFSSLVTNSNNA